MSREANCLKRVLKRLRRAAVEIAKRMPHSFKCESCSHRLTVADSVYESRIRGAKVAVSCPKCSSKISIDGTLAPTASAPAAKLVAPPPPRRAATPPVVLTAPPLRRATPAAGIAKLSPAAQLPSSATGPAVPVQAPEPPLTVPGIAAEAALPTGLGAQRLEAQLHEPQAAIAVPSMPATELAAPHDVTVERAATATPELPHAPPAVLDPHDVTPAGYTSTAAEPVRAAIAADVAQPGAVSKRGSRRAATAFGGVTLVAAGVVLALGLRGSPDAPRGSATPAAPGTPFAPAAPREPSAPAAIQAKPPAVPVPQASAPPSVPVADSVVERAPAEETAPADAAIPAYAPAERVRLSTDAGLLRAEKCHLAGRVTGTVQVFITFESRGRVSEARLEGEPIASAPVGRCVLDQVRAILVPAFDGPAFTLERSLTLR